MTRGKETRAEILRRAKRAGFAFALMLAAALPSAETAMAQKTFTSPEAAADALAAAWRNGGEKQLLALFGAAGEKLVKSGDPVAERQVREKLAASYAEGHHLNAEGADKAVIILGKEDWPYPIPLVKQGASWRFDVAAGAEQIIERRIGRNELAAIEVCRAYVAAQRDYAAKNSGGPPEYAMKVVSSEGKRDGLYWQSPAGSEESPLGPLVAAAEAQGYDAKSAEGRAPFHGYLYKILTRQGKAARGGDRDYVVDGHLTGGFALVAFPAEYGQSGVMTFIVNQNGIVHEKNLGPETAEIAHEMSAYDPDPSWKPVQP
jgi:hypothetical protein